MRARAAEDLAVDFVAEHGDVRVPFQPGDQPVEALSRHCDAARRVGRAVDDDEPGARRDLIEDLVGLEREALPPRAAGSAPASLPKTGSRSR